MWGEALKRGDTECSLYNIKRKQLEGGLNGDWRSESKGENRGINNPENLLKMSFSKTS